MLSHNKTWVGTLIFFNRKLRDIVEIQRSGQEPSICFYKKSKNLGWWGGGEGEGGGVGLLLLLCLQFVDTNDFAIVSMFA